MRKAYRLRRFVAAEVLGHCGSQLVARGLQRQFEAELSPILLEGREL